MVCGGGSVSEGGAEGGGSVLGLCDGGSSFCSSPSLLDGAGGVSFISSLVRVLVFMLMKKNSCIYVKRKFDSNYNCGLLRT